SFSEYATPASTLKFSPQYFASLTFARTNSIDYPEIAPSGILEGWCFSDETTYTASGTLVQPGELIPCIQDLLPIARQMEQAFGNGMRSVDVCLNYNGRKDGSKYLFSKIRLLIAINNQRAAVLGARSLFQHINSNNLLSPVDLERFGDLCISAPISGFQITQFPLWKLKCLLGETWLEEDVVNSLLELSYLRKTMHSTADPSLIILPTS
ncbi:hypothetical protein B0H17DRAFT_910645, partial [Mycena rosella]